MTSGGAAHSTLLAFSKFRGGAMLEKALVVEVVSERHDNRWRLRSSISSSSWVLSLRQCLSCVMDVIEQKGEDYTAELAHEGRACGEEGRRSTLERHKDKGSICMSTLYMFYFIFSFLFMTFFKKK